MSAGGVEGHDRRIAKMAKRLVVGQLHAAGVQVDPFARNLGAMRLGQRSGTAPPFGVPCPEGSPNSARQSRQHTLGGSTHDLPPGVRIPVQGDWHRDGPEIEPESVGDRSAEVGPGDGFGIAQQVCLAVRSRRIQGEGNGMDQVIHIGRIADTAAAPDEVRRTFEELVGEPAGPLRARPMHDTRSKDHHLNPTIAAQPLEQMLGRDLSVVVGEPLSVVERAVFARPGRGDWP